MKKKIWIIVGVVLLVGVVLWINRGKSQKSFNDQQTLPRKAGTESEDEGYKSGESVDGTSGLNRLSPSAKKKRARRVASNAGISDEVKAIIGNGDYVSRHKATKQLSTNLSPEDVAALMEFLTTPLSDHPDMRQIDLNAIKNNVLEALLAQEQLPKGIGQLMMAMHNDPNADAVWCEYCIQFMPALYERQTELTIKYTKDTKNGDALESDKSVDELTAIQDAMISALDQRDNTSAGTALLGLEKLSRTHPTQFDTEAVGDKALEIAADDNASALNRLTAMRLAAQKGRAEVLPVARDLAVNGQTVMLQSAAIATLGDVGTPDDLELLQSLSTSKNRQIAAIAKTSLEKIGKR